MLLMGKPVGITLTDELVWSWRSLGRSLFAKRHLSTTLRVMVFIGLLVALGSGLITGLRYVLLDGLASGLSAGLSFWLLFGLFQGVSSETIGDQHRVVPNQGIRRSARNSLILGLISTAIAGLSAGLVSGLSYGLSYGLSAGLRAECWAPGRTALRGACLSATWRGPPAALACRVNPLELPRVPRLRHRAHLTPQGRWWLYLRPPLVAGVLCILGLHTAT